MQPRKELQEKRAEFLKDVKELNYKDKLDSKFEEQKDKNKILRRQARSIRYAPHVGKKELIRRRKQILKSNHSKDKEAKEAIMNEWLTGNINKG